MGESGPLTGAQLFNKLNCTLALFGQAQVDVPPPLPQFPDLAPQGLDRIPLFIAGGVIPAFNRGEAKLHPLAGEGMAPFLGRQASESFLKLARLGRSGQQNSGALRRENEAACVRLSSIMNRKRCCSRMVAGVRVWHVPHNSGEGARIALADEHSKPSSFLL